MRRKPDLAALEGELQRLRKVSLVAHRSAYPSVQTVLMNFASIDAPDCLRPVRKRALGV